MLGDRRDQSFSINQQKNKKHQQKGKTSKIIQQKVNASTHEVKTNNSGLRNSSNGAFFLQFDVIKVSVYAQQKNKNLQEVKTRTLIQQKVNASIHEVTTNNSGERNSSNGAFFFEFDVSKLKFLNGGVWYLIKSNSCNSE